MNFSDYNTFTYSLLFFAGAAVFSVYWLSMITPENIEKKQKLARNVSIGIILTFIDLLWCIPHSKPLLPESWQAMLLPAVFVCTALAWGFLDYIFARALGGFLILLAYYFLHESFTFHTPASEIFAVFCFIMGIFGICIAGKPYWFRDYIRKTAQSSALKYTSTIFLTAFAVFALIAGISHLVTKTAALPQ